MFAVVTTSMMCIEYNFYRLVILIMYGLAIPT
jgi:hypothetical protein